MHDHPPQSSSVPTATWRDAALLALGLLAFLWVADVQGVMLHRDEYREFVDWTVPLIAYAVAAGLAYWQWDWLVRTLLSWRFLALGGALAGAIAFASMRDPPEVPRPGEPALRAGESATVPEVAHELGAPTRAAWSVPRRVQQPASNVERMGFREREAEMSFDCDVPPGWTRLAPTELRVVNLRVAGDPSGECSVTVLPGGAGGALENVNRWRQQMGLPAIDAAGLAALPRIQLLRQEAVRVELTGTYTGMGSAPLPDAMLLGAIATLPAATLFVKLTGPRELVAREQAGFDLVCSTLRTAQAAPADPHAGGTPQQAAARDDGAAASGLRWVVPPGWREGPPRQMRLVTLVPEGAPDAECSVTELPGTAGGVAGNVNRWREQFGAPPLAAEAIAGLPSLPMLGVEARLVEVEGTFTGMSGAPRPDQAMLGAICPLPDRTVFVKLTGPRAAVRAERDRFLAFCRSLQGS